MRYLYIPLCSKGFTFESIFSTESISPPNFYPIRKFGFDYSYKIPEIHHESAIILFNSIPDYETGDSNTSTIKFVLRVTEKDLNEDELIVIDDGIFAYTETIYLTKENFKLIFFSERDKRLAALKAESSLPTKSLTKYWENLKVDTSPELTKFDTTQIGTVKIGSDGLDTKIKLDKEYNHFKGLVYGLFVGLLTVRNSKRRESSRVMQELINAFAEFNNRLEDYYRNAKYKRSPVVLETTMQRYLDKLTDSINRLKPLLSDKLPTVDFPESSVVSFLLEKLSNQLTNEEEALRYLKYQSIDDILFGSSKYTQVVKMAMEHHGHPGNINHFDNIHNSAIELLNARILPKERLIHLSNIRNTLQTLAKAIDDLPVNESAEFPRLTGLTYSFSKNSISVEPPSSIADEELLGYLVSISNSILPNSKSTKGETQKESILNIVESIGNLFSKNKAAKSTLLYKYLDNQINSYSIETVNSVPLRNFVAFAFNPDSLEKLTNYLVAKEINEPWLAYSFWCAYNGFANTSGNFLQPVFQSNDIEMQNYLDNFLMDVLRQVDATREEAPVDREAENSQSVRRQRALVFFRKFVEGKHHISEGDFLELLDLPSNSEVVDVLKARHGINKRDGKKLASSLLLFLNSEDLFQTPNTTESK